MKIVSFVEGAYHRAGGLGLVGVPRIARSLAERGHEVILNVAGSPIAGAPLPAQNRNTSATSHVTNFQIVVHPAFGKWALSPLMPMRIHRQVAEADFITLHSLYSFPVLLGHCFALELGIPYGVWPHGVLAPFQRTVSAGKKRLYDTVFARRILERASVLFYSAEGERVEASVLGFKTPSVVVPHGIEAGDFAKLPQYGRFRRVFLTGHEGPLVLYLGRLNAKKGIDLLIEAFASVLREFPDAILAIAGAGDPPAFETQLRQCAARHGAAKRVIFTGLLNEEQKHEALADSDLLALPSYAENFAFAMFEAAASRVPVVVSDTLNLAGEVHHYGAGLVRPRNPSDFAAAIVYLLKNPSLRREMGDAGLRMAMAYSWETTGLRVEQTIQRIISGKPLPAG